MSLILTQSLFSQTLTTHGIVEVGTVFSDLKRLAGHEVSIGDFFANFRFEISYGSTNIYFDWIPKETTLDSTDWKYSDAYVARPYFLPGINVHWYDLQLTFGAFIASGLEPISSVPTSYYLSGPLPLLLSRRYDKGVKAKYHPNDVITFELAVVDGDWTLGDSDVFASRTDSNNSYPSYAIGFEVTPTRYIYFGTTNTTGDTGSYPGDKRREDDIIVYTGFRHSLASARTFISFMGRNQTGDGSGRHTDAVHTGAVGLEVSYWIFYGSVWYMKNFSNQPDGEIWFNYTDNLLGWSIGAKWKMVGVQYERLGMDNIIVTSIQLNW